MMQPSPDTSRYSAAQYRSILQTVGVVLSFTKGVSMRPLIRQGTHYVAVVPLEGEPQVDDLLLFEQCRPAGTACVLHRLIAVEGDTYITRGDNCLGCERIRREDIIGRVSHIYRVGQQEGMSVSHPAYLRYVRLWTALWPLRRPLYWMRGVAYGTMRRLRSLFRKS